jgi:non-specific serine/threonine protein kinase
MWREMSVYVGGWDLAAAEWVAGTERSVASTLDIVQSLLEKSILVRRQSAGTTWYSMLGTIREFGLSRLKAESALARVQEQHREWYRQLLHRAEEEWIGADQPAWLALLRRELPNIRNALVFCIQSLDGAAALDLTLTAWRIRWQPDARIDELRRWLLRALALPGSDGTPNRAQAFALLAVIENGQGDRAAAMRHLAEARRIAVALDDPYTTSCVDTAEAELETDPDRAVSLYRAAIAVQPNTGEIVARVDPSTRLALFYDRIGRASEARVLRNRILDVLARRGEQYEASYLLMHAGAFAAERGELDAAIELSRAALKLKRTLVNPVGVAHIEEVLASVAVQRRQYGRAATLLGSAASERQEVGDLPSSFSSLVENLGELTETARKSLGSDAFDRAVERGRALTHDEGIAFALEEPAEHATAKAIEPPRDVPTLTPREEEVAALVARGLSDREIASELVVSLRTAQGHVQRILVKLGLTSRTQLAAWYLTSFPQTEGWESA